MQKVHELGQPQGDACQNLAMALLDSSRAMLAAAKGEQWGQLETIECQRQAIMAALFAASPATDGEAENLAALIQDVQEINEALAALVKQERHAVARQLRALRTAVQAGHAYSSQRFY